MSSPGSVKRNQGKFTTCGWAARAAALPPPPAPPPPPVLPPEVCAPYGRPSTLRAIPQATHLATVARGQRWRGTAAGARAQRPPHPLAPDPACRHALSDRPRSFAVAWAAAETTNRGEQPAHSVLKMQVEEGTHRSRLPLAVRSSSAPAAITAQNKLAATVCRPAVAVQLSVVEAQFASGGAWRPSSRAHITLADARKQQQPCWTTDEVRRGRASAADRSQAADEPGASPGSVVAAPESSRSGAERCAALQPHPPPPAATRLAAVSLSAVQKLAWASQALASSSSYWACSSSSTAACLPWAT